MTSVAELLDTHELHFMATETIRGEEGPGNYWLYCTCGARFRPDGGAGWKGHLAEMLEALVAEREQAAVDDAVKRVRTLADEWERDTPVWHDPVDGPVTELRQVIRKIWHDRRPRRNSVEP